MLFDSVVMRLQVIGELVGKLMKEPTKPLASHPEIPWVQIYDMRNLISPRLSRGAKRQAHAHEEAGSCS